PAPTRRAPDLDRGRGRGDPARLGRVAGVGARAARLETELAAGLEDGLAHPVVAVVRAPDLQAGGARHAVAQRADLLAADLHAAHGEELGLLDRAAVELLDDVPRPRPLDLEPPHVALDGLAVGAHRRARVELDVDVVALRGPELQVVGHRGAADVDEPVLGLA